MEFSGITPKEKCTLKLKFSLCLLRMYLEFTEVELTELSGIHFYIDITGFHHSSPCPTIAQILEKKMSSAYYE